MNETLCMGCMQDKGNETVCPHCGYEEGTAQYQSCLPPRTMIGSRYLVGRVLRCNSEGILYIGFDTMNRHRVEIQEYFPETLASRDPDGKTVRVNDGKQISFKANLGDYQDMQNKLIRMRTLSCLVQTYGLVEENQTFYAIRESVDGLSLRDYMIRRGAMLTWQEASDLLLPAVKTLRLLHQDGMLHRGLSADTLYVTQKGLIKIGGFAISAVRAARTELPAELFPGFSAPEQYSAVSPHGTWTDVYGICAVFYSVLTGQRPPEALIRSEDKQLMSPRERNETVPDYVSDALLHGLCLDIQHRIQDMDTLLGELTGIPVAPEHSTPPPVHIQEEEPEEEENVRMDFPAHRPSFPKTAAPTAYYHPASHQPEPPESKPEPPASREESREAERRRTRRLIMNSMLIALPILLLILIFTFWMLFGGKNNGKNPNSRPESSGFDAVASDEWLVPSYPESPESSEYNPAFKPESSHEESSREESKESSREESSEPEESSKETQKMENFVGMDYQEIVSGKKYEGLYVFAEPLYAYSDEQPQGYVVRQDITAGLEVSKGTRVVLTVSKGSQKVRLPSFEKQTEQAYLTKLDKLEISYRVIYQTDSSYPAGYVVGTSGENGYYDQSSGVPLDVYVAID